MTRSDATSTPVSIQTQYEIDNGLYTGLIGAVVDADGRADNSASVLTVGTQVVF